MKEIDVSETSSAIKQFDTRLHGSARTRKLLPQSQRGLELQEMLRREFGIPEQTRWFQIRFAMGEVVTVTCEYIPTE